MVKTLYKFLIFLVTKHMLCNNGEFKVDSRWKEVKLGVEIKIGKINDKELLSALENLIVYNFIKKMNEEYYIIDPLLKELEYNC